MLASLNVSTELLVECLALPPLLPAPRREQLKALGLSPTCDSWAWRSTEKGILVGVSPCLKGEVLSVFFVFRFVCLVRCLLHFL